MLNDKRLLAQLGFLYAGYTARCWYWELVDTAHKLLVTSILAFLPIAAQLPVGMAVVVAYLCVILWLNPYLRLSDDLFHILCQVEVLALLIIRSPSSSRQSPADTNIPAPSCWHLHRQAPGSRSRPAAG